MLAVALFSLLLCDVVVDLLHSGPGAGDGAGAAGLRLLHNWLGRCTATMLLERRSALCCATQSGMPDARTRCQPMMLGHV